MAALLTSELADLTRALEKAAPAQGAAPVAADASATAGPSTPTTGDLPRALDILRSMLSARVTVEELKLTKAGLLVARLSKSEQAEMAKLAKEVMAQWKKAVLPPSAPTGVEQAKAAAAAAAQAKAAADAKKAAEAAAAAAAVAKKKKKEADGSSKKSSGESSSDESERDRDGKKDKKKDTKRSKEKDGESKEESKKKRSKTSPSPTPAATKAPVTAPKPAAVGSDASLALQHPELARDGPFALFRTDDSQRDKMQWMIYSALGDPTPAAHQALAEEQEKAKVDLSQYKSNSSKATAAPAVAAPVPEEESKTAPSDAAPDAAVAVAASPSADSTAPASALPADPTPAAIPAVATATPSLRSRAELAFLIEAAMFNKLGQNSNSTAYKQKYRDLAPQLKDPNNGELNVSLYLGRLVPDELVMMSLAALAPAALKDKRAKEAAWSREAARCDIGLDAGATDIFQCDVCKERRCTYFQMQTRGADEPMTIFVTCLVCGNKFRSGDGER